jgi:hypothetical protein
MCLAEEMKRTSLLPALLVACAGTSAGQDDLAPLLADLEQHGEEPARFVLERLGEADLVLFDDGLHSAVEPFEFYAELVRNPEFRRAVDFVFLEVVAVNQQPHLDAFLASGDPADLLPAFRNDVSGTGGIGYRTYLELLAAIRAANLASPPEERLRVVAVSNPVDWDAITTREGFERFNDSLANRDEDMYRVIQDELDGFRSGRKGIFLTNTRHAYTGVRRSDGRLFGDTGTLFRQRHPGKTCSIRIHNVTLAIERAVADPKVPRTAQGLEDVQYHWARVDGGRWDRAFAANGNLPIAVPLAGTSFGRAPYLGNHQLEAAPGQTMADAYDALVFLAPLERLRQAAAMPGLYAADFLPELARRYRLMRTADELSAEMKAAGAGTALELVTRNFVEWPESPVPAVQ